MADKQFVDGLIIKKPAEQAPDFVKFKVSIKRYEFLKWLEAQPNGEWVNLQVNEAQSGKYYAEVDTFKPKPREDDPFR